MKNFLSKLCLVLSIVLFIAGIGLLIWVGVGQYFAQIRLDGQYVSWRVIPDVSQWGYTGFGAIAISFGLFVLFNKLD